MKYLIEMERPDLAIVSGDVISNYKWNGKAGWVEKLWKQFNNVFKETETYYAVSK